MSAAGFVPGVATLLDTRRGNGARVRTRRTREVRCAISDKRSSWLQRRRERRSAETRSKTKVTVCGGGSFGTAMAFLLARNGYPVQLLVRKDWVRDEINTERRNPKYFPEFVLPNNLTATTDADDALRNSDFVVHAIPVQQSRDFLLAKGKYVPDNVPVLCTSKGLEVTSLKFMCELLPELLPQTKAFAFLSGPSFAREMMESLPTAVVVASEEIDLALQIADMLSSPSFKVFTSSDTIGVEVAGAVKNVIAIAAGICEGLGLGTNSMAALVTRGCSEMRRLALNMGASPVTLSGLSGVGDTFLTCFGPLSRNRTVGVRLGKGESLEDILSSSRQVAEGVMTAEALVKMLLEQYNGETAKAESKDFNVYATRAAARYPILFGVRAILEGRITPQEGVEALLAMPPREEN
mmetsp:Transcript_2116/g.6309  ORF Transcript_2116/g.6309 Transcript_2116/m.6309 type:complete len:409 (+) Transcript_2116:101-1327(+)|eukprot:CAMPEP_0198737738 /NCGR_PEP_ID=MMETSP1475-20131203/68020_1 /TAXON_ID= ORGANISM="Unidentified sp., Strain CCMP1999" /NCGR_SAMPLE_ID=MMETSP1475 /ASSEMBLY_ACC=CAM_ASM_001111 /LENGTH=408 /DNA_ID=CAMNT_0044501607 /DNA_START=74 /DNA_END=1300 /DNA_ORIENTATION=+